MAIAALGLWVTAACSGGGGDGGNGGDGDPPPPELTFEFGPTGHGASTSCVAPPTLPPEPEQADPKGCVSSYAISPGVLTVTMLTAGVPAAGGVTAAACKWDSCHDQPAQPTSPLDLTSYTANIPTAGLDGVTKLCAFITVLNIAQPGPPPGEPPRPPLRIIQMTCLPLKAPLRQGAGAFKVTPGAEGLILEGWAVDVGTDGPGTFTVRNGTEITSPHVDLTADLVDPRSRDRMPGFPAEHGFTAVLPYTGDPGPTHLCVALRRSANAMPRTAPRFPIPDSRGSPAASHSSTPSAADEGRLACFTYDEPSEAFSAKQVQQGDPIHIMVRNVGPGTQVSVNLLSDAGYFLLPWEFEKWVVTAGPGGGADVVIDSSRAPAGDYSVAFTCQPACPRVDVNGTPDWKGPITLSSRLLVAATPGGPTLNASKTTSDSVHVTGSGFTPGQELRLIAFPHLLYSDGPPVEGAMVVYPVPDTAGRFSTEVDLAGFPLSNTRTQLVAYDSSEHPVASFMYSSF